MKIAKDSCIKLFTNVKFILTTLIISLTVIFSPISTSSAYAETKMMKVYTKFSDEELLNLIKKKYPDAEILKKGKIVVEALSSKMLIDNSRDNGSLSFYVYFDDADISLKKLNQWNSSKRFFYAYKNDDAVFLQNDLDVEKGIGEGYLVDHISSLFLITMFFSSEMSK